VKSRCCAALGCAHRQCGTKRQCWNQDADIVELESATIVMKQPWRP